MNQVNRSNNLNQIALAKWISAGLKIEEVRSSYGDASYLLSNMIAKYSLAADRYQVSKEALREFNNLNVDLSQIYSRSKFHGKKSKFIYEHSIPASVVKKMLLESNSEEETVLNILEQSGSVVVLLRNEDNAISSAGFRGEMSPDWHWGDDKFARYRLAGIDLSGSYLNVKGRLMR